MKRIHFILILFIAFFITSCGESKKSSISEYTTKEVVALDLFYYEYNGYNYNAYMAYFGDNTGFARVFTLQYGSTLGYKDTWFNICINDTNDGLSYTPTDNSILNDIPFIFEISKSNNYSVCYSLDGCKFPIRVRPVKQNEIQDVLSSVRVPLKLEYPNK